MVVSAHAADFVWRAGGAIALYAERGWEVTVVCLSYRARATANVASLPSFGESEK